MQRFNGHMSQQVQISFMIHVRWVSSFSQWKKFAQNEQKQIDEF